LVADGASTVRSRTSAAAWPGEIQSARPPPNWRVGAARPHHHVAHVAARPLLAAEHADEARPVASAMPVHETSEAPLGRLDDTRAERLHEVLVASVKPISGA
jgi:hypothetical protein